MAGPKDTLPVGKVVPMPIRPAVIKPQPIIVGGPGILPPRLPPITTPKARPTGLSGPASAKIAAARTAREDKDLNMNSLKDKIDQISSSSDNETSDSELNSKASSSSTSDSESSASSSSSSAAQAASSSEDTSSDSKSESESESDEESS